MAEASYPFDSQSVTEAQWAAMGKLWAPSGVIRGEDQNLEVFADATGMQVKVRTGKAWVDGHYYVNDATKTVTIAAAHATLPRIDRVVLRVARPSNTVTAEVLTGTAAGSPSAPALTQSSTTWEIPLAQVSVPAADTGIDAGQVTDERQWSGVWDEQVVPYSVAGTLVVAAGQGELTVEYPTTITFVRARVKTAPAGSSVIVDVNKNGTTIFTTQANRPTIAAAGNTSGKVTNADVKTLAAGDVLSVDVDAVGSTTPGSDLIVTVGLQRTGY